MQVQGHPTSVSDSDDGWSDADTSSILWDNTEEDWGTKSASRSQGRPPYGIGEMQALARRQPVWSWAHTQRTRHKSQIVRHPPSLEDEEGTWVNNVSQQQLVESAVGFGDRDGLQKAIRRIWEAELADFSGISSEQRQNLIDVCPLVRTGKINVQMQQVLDTTIFRHIEKVPATLRYDIIGGLGGGDKCVIR